MKKFVTHLSFAFAIGIFASSCNSNVESHSTAHSKLQFKVLGNCEMCKEKIEETLKESNGVKSADWDVHSKILTVKYDSVETNLDNIYKTVSTTGYDSEKLKASDEAYSKLHKCCQYERKIKYNN